MVSSNYPINSQIHQSKDKCFFPQNNTPTPKIEVVGFIDVNRRGGKDDCKRTAGFVLFVEGVPVSLSSKKEQVIVK